LVDASVQMLIHNPEAGDFEWIESLLRCSDSDQFQHGLGGRVID
jgi:hypothetical protein